MVLWFVGLSLVLMWIVFRDPAIDHRLVVAGALLPDLVDVAAGGGARWAHSVAGGVLALAVVMAVTVGRRRLRRALLAVPIGMFFHLVLDGAWTDTGVFWWPAQGWSFDGAALPLSQRSLGVNLAMELAGALALWWAYVRFGLGDPARRSRFLRTGRIDRELTEGVPPAC